MAIDSRHKRFSMMGMRSHALRGTTIPLFEATGSVDNIDRQHLLGLYSGIAFSSALNALLMLPHEYRGGYHQATAGFQT